MRVTKLTLKNFRGFENLDIDFAPKQQTHILVGINGSGKTSILEAIAILLSNIFKDIETLEFERKDLNVNHEGDGIKSSIDFQLGNQTYKKNINKSFQLKKVEQELKNIGEDSPELAHSYTNLALIYKDLGDLEQALNFQNKGIEILKKIYSKSHPVLANSYNNLALIYKDLGDLEKALSFQNKGIQILEKIYDTHPDLAISYNNLGLTYQALGNLKKALIFQNKALAIREKIYDKNHPYLASSYNNLALLYKDLNDLEEALIFINKALSIQEKIFDRNHPNLATSYNNLAAIHKELGDLNQALIFINKTLSIQEKILDKNHPDLGTSYNNIATIYKELGDLEKALVFNQKALSIQEKISNKNHPNLATSYSNLASIYKDLGDLQQALTFQNKALSIREKIYDKNHPYLAISYNNLALIYQVLGDLQQALFFQSKAVSIREKIYDKNHPYLAGSYNSLVQIHTDLGNSEKALVFKNKALAIQPRNSSSKPNNQTSFTSPTSDINNEKKSPNSYITNALQKGKPIPILLFYAVKRNIVEQYHDEQISFPYKQLRAYYKALSGTSNFADFFDWFKEEEDLENERIRDDRSYVNPQLEVIRQALESIFSNFRKVRIRRQPKVGMTLEKSTNTAKNLLYVNQLSEGERGFIALIGDIARRLSIANPSLDNPLEGKGIVMIDEIDLHLHPKWQRKIIPDLERTFPNIQFIVTTHSPQVISSVKKESLLLLKDFKIIEPPPIYGRDSNSILYEVMKVEKRPKKMQERLDKLFVLLDEEENLAKGKELLQELIKDLGPNDPDIQQAESIIDFLYE